MHICEIIFSEVDFGLNIRTDTKIKYASLYAILVCIVALAV